MLKKLVHAKLMIGITLVAISVLSSCVSKRDSVYFSDLSDTAKLLKLIPAKFNDPLIQPDDILNITIQTIDPSVTAIVNQESPSTEATPGSSFGYLVSKDGFITIPMLGKLKVDGISTAQAMELIRGKASAFFKDPTVQVRFANFKITVIGEVARPSTYSVPNEKVTLLDALGLAGDLTIYGKRENLLLIRENAGNKEFVRFNLNSSEIFKSPYFYLKQNDVIYVEPGPGKVAVNNAARTQVFAITGTVISLLAIIITRFF